MIFSAFLLFTSFVFGAIIGSFLNVVILRFNTGKSIFGPQERSQCFSCGKKLQWWELVPILSFLFLRGRCSECKSKISWQYPAVEAITGVLFTLLINRLLGGFAAHTLEFVSSRTITEFLFYGIVLSVLVVITFYDLRHKIIPNELVYTFAGLSAAHALYFWYIGTFSLSDILAGPIFFAAFAGLWFASGGKWLGFGDAKLVLGIGLMLGLVQGLSAIVLAFWIGAVVSVGMIVLQRRLLSGNGQLTMKSEIPFAPFLVVGTIISFFWNADILGLSRFFW